MGQIDRMDRMDSLAREDEMHGMKGTGWCRKDDDGIGRFDLLE